MFPLWALCLGSSKQPEGHYEEAKAGRIEKKLGAGWARCGLGREDVRIKAARSTYKLKVGRKKEQGRRPRVGQGRAEEGGLLEG